MRHTFRVNTYDDGYVLASVDDGVVRTHPLDVESDYIKKAYLERRRAFSALLERNEFPSYMAFSVPDDTGAQLAYCKNFHVADKYNRVGIEFDHFVEGDVSEIVDVLQSALWLLSPQGERKHFAVVRELSRDRIPLDQALKFYLNMLFEHEARFAKLTSPVRSPDAILHDCDARSLAWRAMLSDHLEQDRPWGIADTLDDSGRFLTVSSSFDHSTPPRLLSSLLTECLEAYGTAENKVSAATSEEPENVHASDEGAETRPNYIGAAVTAGVARPTELDRMLPTTAGEAITPTPSHAEAVEAAHVQHPRVEPSPNYPVHDAVAPLGTTLKVLHKATSVSKSWRDNGFVINDSRGHHEVNSERCIAFGQDQYYFYFEMKRGLYWLFRDSKTLCVPRWLLDPGSDSYLQSCGRWLPRRPEAL